MIIFDTFGYLTVLGQSCLYNKESKIFKFDIRIGALIKDVTYVTQHNK